MTRRTAGHAPATTSARRSTQLDQLLSVAIIATANIERDVTQARAALETVQRHTSFFEILIVAASPDETWVEAMKVASATIPNVNILLFDPSYIDNFDKLMLAAMEAAIGDSLLIITPGEFSDSDQAALLAEGLKGQRDIIKACYAKPHIPLIERAALAIYTRILWAISRHVLLPFPARTLFVARSAIAKILGNYQAFQYVRILDTSRFLRELVVTFTPVRPPKLFTGLRRKLAVAAELSASAAPRFLALFSVLSASMALFGLLYGFYALLVLTFKHDVAAGWTSTSLFISLMSMMIFALLGLVSLGIMRIINLQETRGSHASIQEISNADLFAHLRDLNIELTEESH